MNSLEHFLLENKNSVLYLEIVLCGFLCLLAVVRPQFGNRFAKAVSRALGWAAQRRALAVVGVGLLGYAASAAVGLWKGNPVPYVSDEFSYLLAADTYAHGRLTNPPHPLWVHFETLGILQQPTYISKYPPGQGMILALGQVLTGRPIVGAWISIGLMSAALCWMLMAWVPPRWAILGGLLSILQFGAVSTWSQGYMGGAVAATGGALYYGALMRLMKRPQACYALLTGLGVAILANSRPYEGAVTALPGMIFLAVRMFGRKRPPGRIVVREVILPLAAVLVLTGAAIGYVNWRVTGSPLRMPYMVHEKQYAVAPSFIWQPLRPTPNYRHESIRAEYTGPQELGTYLKERSVDGFLELSLVKIRVYWRFYFGETLTLCLLVLPWAWTDRNTKFALLACGTLLAGLLLISQWGVHYAAPATCLFLFLILQCLRRIRLLEWRHRPIGRFAVGAVVISCLVFPFVSAWRPEAMPAWRLTRQRILENLRRSGGKHLIVVDYAPDHNSHDEWIYNRADIDGSAVVWARLMDKAENRRLLDYFKTRRAWLLEADAHPPRLLPMPPELSAN